MSRTHVEELTKSNIEGIIIDTRKSMKFTGDFEWIRSVNNNGRVTDGSSIHIPRMREFDIKKDITMGTSSHAKINDEFMKRIKKYPIIGYADNSNEVIDLIQNQD